MGRIRVNQAEIPAEVIAAECQNHPAASAAAARRAATEALVVRELLLQEAARLGLASVPATDGDGRTETVDEALIRALLEDQVETPRADGPTCRRYYENNRERFRRADLFEASHILLSADRADEARYAGAVAEAKAIIATLIERPGAFAEIARRRSDCPTARDGGALGQVTRGQTTPEFETFLLVLDEGQLCPQPVKTPYGVHVLRLDRRRAGQILPFEAVRDLIAEYLEEASWRRAVSQYIKLLAGRADIQGVDMAGVGGWLVQ